MISVSVNVSLSNALIIKQKDTNMNKKVLIVPDVHGRLFWKEAMSKIDEVDLCVFLGDYVDPYEFEANTISSSEPERLVDNVKDIIKFARDYSPKVVLLLGNHDAHYICDALYIRSSRYNSAIKNGLLRTFEQNKDLFRKCLAYNGVLFSHAGVTKAWLCYNGYTGDFDNINEIASFIEGSAIDDTAQVGRARGGNYPSGGPMWADLGEHTGKDFSFPQAVGHTQLRQTGSVACIGNVTCYDSRSIHIIEV